MTEHPEDTAATPAVPYVDLASLGPKEAAIIERAREKMGFVPNSILTYLHRPEIADTVLAMAAAITSSPQSTLLRELKVKLGIICSATNGCVFCTAHQCNIAQNPLGSHAGAWHLDMSQLQALATGDDRGDGPLEALCFEFARTASHDPHGVSIDLLERMKQAMSSPQVVELAAVVGFRKFFNTIHDSLHLPSEAALSHFSEIVSYAQSASEGASLT